MQLIAEMLPGKTVIVPGEVDEMHELQDISAGGPGPRARNGHAHAHDEYMEEDDEEAGPRGGVQCQQQ